MALSDILDRPWKKYVAATVGTVLASVAAKKAVTSVDDYLQLHPPESQVMQLSADQLHELRGDLEGLAYAGGTPEAPMTKVPGLDYEFDGGVYTKETIDMNRFNQINKKVFHRKDGDFDYVFTVPDLYEKIGKHIKPKYDEIKFVGFGNKDVSEIGVHFKIDGKVYVGFINIDEEIRKLMEKYSK